MLWFTRMPPPPAGAPRSTGLQCRGFGRGPQLHWHISCLELLAVHLALNRLKRRLQGKHVLVRTDTLWPLHTSTDKVVYASVACRNSPATSSYGVRSIWGSALCHSHSGLAQPGSRRAVTSCAPRRVETPSPDGPAYWEISHCQLFTPWPRKHLARNALALSWPRGPRKYAYPPVSLLAQTLCKIREDKEQVLLVAPYWPTQTWFPELMLLVTAPPWQIPLR